MRKITVLLLFSVLFSVVAFSQSRLKISYLKCEPVSDNIFVDVRKYKTFNIQSEEEFNNYFKLTSGNAIDFNKNIVLVGLTGDSYENKFITINAATYDAKSKIMSVRFDIEDSKRESNGKFCVVVVPKSPNHKQVSFLKGKAYNMSQSSF